MQTKMTPVSLLLNRQNEKDNRKEKQAPPNAMEQKVYYRTRGYVWIKSTQ